MGAPRGNKNAAGPHKGRKGKSTAKRSRQRKLGGLPVKDGYVFTGSKFIPVKQYSKYLKRGY